MNEKRQHRRIKRRLTVKFGEKGLTQNGYTLDLSQGGLFLVTSAMLPLQSRLHLQLYTDASEFVLLEGEVRRKKEVPPQLRSVERAGFGVRFLHPGEVVKAALRAGGTAQLTVTYDSPQALKAAYDAELVHGGVFIPMPDPPAVQTKVVVELELLFATRTIELDATVVHSAKVGAQGPAGAGLMFQDRAAAKAALSGYLPK